MYASFYTNRNTSMLCIDITYIGNVAYSHVPVGSESGPYPFGVQLYTPILPALIQ